MKFQEMFFFVEITKILPNNSDIFDFKKIF